MNKKNDNEENFITAQPAQIRSQINDILDSGAAVEVTFMESTHNGKVLPEPMKRTLTLKKAPSLIKEIKGNSEAAKKGAVTAFNNDMMTVPCVIDGAPAWRRVNLKKIVKIELVSGNDDTLVKLFKSEF